MAETIRPDPYAVLGIPRDAQEDEVRAAYRRLVRSEHPDTGGSHDRFIMVTWAYETLTAPQRHAMFDAEGVGSDGSGSNWDAYEAEQDLGPSRPVPSCTVLDFGTLSPGLSRAMRFDVFYDADPPEVDYQPRVGRWWTTAALAVDDPRVAIQIEVIVAVPADTPSGDLCDRIVVTFDDANSTEIEIRGELVGEPVGATASGPPAVAPSSRAAVRRANPAEPVPRRRHRPARYRQDPMFRHRITMSVIWPFFGLSCVALVFALAFGYAIPAAELPNILWLQFIAIPLCALSLGVAVFALLPWTIAHAVRQWRPKRVPVRTPSRPGMPSTTHGTGPVRAR